MKKLLLLIFLFLFLPTQGFAVTFCSDGSMPTRAISADGSYYEYKCVGKQNKSNTSTNYGPKRLFDSGTSWTFNATGRLSGTNGMSCAFLTSNFIGTCNTGINYGLCVSYVNADLCGSDGTTYNFYNDSVRSSFGSYCSIYGTSTEIIFNS